VNEPVAVTHIVAGRVVEGTEVVHPNRGDQRSFATPKLAVDSLVWPRHTPGPAFDLPVGEIIDFLVATGALLRSDASPLDDALRSAVQLDPTRASVLEHGYRKLPEHFDRASLEFQVQHDLGGAEVIDGWCTVHPPGSNGCSVRAFPPRLVHVLAGNGPGVAATTIVQAALTKGLHLLKLPSNDLFTATAILRSMVAIDPEHPVVRSFSAVYWKGGDEAVEPYVFRPQWFDKLVAWGGEAALRSALRYAGPGLELVSFDPKVSISLIGREAFESEATLTTVAELAVADATVSNQESCAASRYQFVEGNVEESDRFCTLLVGRLTAFRPHATATPRPTPAEIRDEVEVLRLLEPDYRVWGSYDGDGLVVRSMAPVDFHPTHRTVNVVPVDSLGSATRFVTVATQTVGIYPPARSIELRDSLARAGAQRLVPLGRASLWRPGLPHDAMYPLRRLVRWIVDQETI